MPHSADYFGPYFSKKGLKLPARIISIIFHPIFVTFGTAMLLYWLQKPEYISIQNKYPFFIGFLLLNLVVLPLVSTLLMKALGFIGSITMKNPRDRIIPLIATMIFYFWAYNVAKNTNPEAPFYMRVYLLGSFWGIIMIFLINIFFKISMHTTAIASTVGILLLMILQLKTDILWIIVASIILAGIIGTSRLILKEHLPFELILGYITGFLVQVGAYYFLL